MDVGTARPRLDLAVEVYEGSGAHSPPMRHNLGPTLRQKTCKPLLLVDVDGVLSLFGREVDVRTGAGTLLMVDGIPHFLSEAAGNHLRGLAGHFECVWCTGWEEKADEYLRSLYALPRTWPHLTFAGAEAGRHWKLAAIEAHAGPERPVAWIDDAFDPSCEAWAAERAGPTLLVRTDPARGLTAAEAGALLAWASAPGSRGG